MNSGCEQKLESELRIIRRAEPFAGNSLSTLHWKRHRAASCSFKMISFSNINKQYGKQLLFVDASFQLNPGEKVGLVGPNGAGKTTLFRMVVGEETPDEGAVSVPKKLTIGYFRQDVEEMQSAGARTSLSPAKPWCPETESNRHVLLGTRDFKSRASASFAIRATRCDQ